MNAPQDATADRASADIALVCTHKGELRPFLRRLDRQRSYTEGSLTVRGGFLRETIRIVVAEVGPGFAKHRAAAHQRARHAILHAEFGIQRGLRIGPVGMRKAARGRVGFNTCDLFGFQGVVFA